MDELDGMVETSLEEMNEIGEEISEEHQAARKRWEIWVAVSVSILAVLGTAVALLAAFSADEVLKDRIHEIVGWTRYENDRLGYEVLINRHTILDALNEPIAPDEIAKREQYLQHLEQYQETIQELELEATKLVYEHHIFAIAITVFQTAIAMSSVAVVIRRKIVWQVGLSVAGIGLVFAIWGTVLFFS